MFILDTNVLSAVRRADRAPKVAAWLAAQTEGDLYISAITIGEIARGIGLQKRQNPEFARDLRAWLDRTVSLFGDRILPLTTQDAQIWGSLSAQIGHNGADLMIAAQALARDAQVVTGNGRDFAQTGVQIIDPF